MERQDGCVQDAVCQNMQNWQKCPASGSRCRKCSKPRHWKSLCRSKVTTKINRVEEADDEGEEAEKTVFLGVVSNVNDRGDNFVFKAHVSEFHADFRFIVDLHANITCIPLKTVPKSYRNRIRSSRKIIYLGPDGKRLTLLGFIET